VAGEDAKEGHEWRTIIHILVCEMAQCNMFDMALLRESGMLIFKAYPFAYSFIR
jgi:hypothetical protein